MSKNERNLLSPRQPAQLPTKLETTTTAENTIEKVSNQLMVGGFSGMLQPREQQLIVSELKASQEEKVVQTAICRVRAEAESKVVEITLLSEELRESILLEHNQRAGSLYRQHQSLVHQSMTKVIKNEALDQDLLSRSDVLEEDRQMLTQFLRQQASEEIQSVASTNGVALSEPETTHNP